MIKLLDVNMFPLLPSSDFMSSIIQTAIRTLDCAEDWIMDEKTKCTVVYNKHSNINIRILRKEIMKACHIIRAMRFLFDYTGTIYFTWFMTDLKKKMPTEKDAIISPDNVNSGYTMMHEKREIFIYRREEAMKVLTHELIHLFNIDTNLLSWDRSIALDKIIELKFNIRSLNGRLGTPESICDTMAIWLVTAWHTCCISEKKWAKCMREQYDFMIYQAIKIMNYMMLSRHGFSENSHVFSYYVIKAAISQQHDLVTDIFTHALRRESFSNIEERILDSLYMFLQKGGMQKYQQKNTKQIHEFDRVYADSLRMTTI
jgi:hypothetical protein